MSDWRDCIVSFIDLIGIAKKLGDQKSEAIVKMRSMHQAVCGASSNSLPRHKHVYYWNDSVLMLALVRSKEDYEPVMREVNGMKRTIGRICRCYVVSIKGQTIPESLPYAGATFIGRGLQPKAVYIRASSMAFANCFLVEKELGKEYKKSWYVDVRIAKHIHVAKKPLKKSLTLFPGNSRREIYMYDGDLWSEDLCSEP